MIASAGKIHRYARQINSIFPKDGGDKERRISLINLALVELDIMANQAHLTTDLVSFKANKEYKIGRWCALIDSEIRLLQGLKKSDKRK